MKGPRVGGSTVEAEIHARRIQREPPQAHAVRPVRPFVRRFRADSAGALDAYLGIATAHLGCRLRRVRGPEVVEEHHVGPGRGRLHGLLHRVRLHLHELRAIEDAASPDRVRDGDAGREVVVLHEERIRQAESMRVPAAQRHRTLLVGAEARRGLAGRRHAARGIHRRDAGLHVVGQRGDAAHAHEEVQCKAFRREHIPGLAFDAENDRSRGHRGAVVHGPFDAHAEAPEDGAGLVHAGDDAGLAGAHDAGHGDAGVHEGERRDVACADVLCKESVEVRRIHGAAHPRRGS